ncbi:hypothetical protein E2C01_063902 [Portunus trituberculatus]|uniref:Uncharacterized protein n=1 Tax=Portunus trituberculatus TaxID=210409 RepID=A0A5B7HEX7_PORTR|nr:hypothetical protein [Portunus trituberculatus]
MSGGLLPGSCSTARPTGGDNESQFCAPPCPIPPSPPHLIPPTLIPLIPPYRTFASGARKTLFSTPKHFPKSQKRESPPPPFSKSEEEDQFCVQGGANRRASSGPAVAGSRQDPTASQHLPPRSFPPWAQHGMVHIPVAWRGGLKPPLRTSKMPYFTREKQ